MNNNAEQEINKIRVELYNESKNLSSSEQIKKTNETAKKIADKYGLKLISGKH
jgi:hypothetical protein